MASQTTNSTNGTHALRGFENGITLTALHNDTMTGAGSGDSFMFNTGVGHDTLTDFAQHLSDPGHDTVYVASSEFTDFNYLMAHTQNSGSNAVITGAGSDTITLAGTNKATLQAHQGDFLFHA